MPAKGDAPNRVRGYHKPIMIAGGLGNIRRPHVEKSEVTPGSKLVVLGGPAMLIGLGGGAASSVGGRVERRARFRIRAARQSRDAAPCAGSDRPLLGARRRQPDPAGARRRRGRAVECGARGRGAQPARRAHRTARRAERRARHVADGDLVQRSAGALRPGHRGGRRCALRGAVPPRALPVRGDRHADGRWPAARARSAARRRERRRHADRSAARQAAPDAARCAPRASRRAGRSTSAR